jgi:hypothetical protein
MRPIAGVVRLRVAILAVAQPLASMAEPGLVRVGIKRSGGPPDPFADAFVDEMQTLDVRGRTISYEMRWAKGNSDRLPELAPVRRTEGRRGGGNALQAAERCSST